jgi:hypothetical protein
MSFKQHRADAIILLAHLESIINDPSLTPADGKLDTTLEIAVAQALDRAEKGGWENARATIQTAITEMKRS